MDAGINNVIYMELNSGPKIAKSTCGKTIVAGTIDRGSTVFEKYTKVQTVSYEYFQYEETKAEKHWSRY